MYVDDNKSMSETRKDLDNGQQTDIDMICGMVQKMENVFERSQIFKELSPTFIMSHLEFAYSVWISLSEQEKMKEYVTPKIHKLSENSVRKTIRIIDS